MRYGHVLDTSTQNGIMNPGMLYEAPFTDLHSDGLDGMFNNDADIEGIITIVSEFNKGADVKESAA